MALRVSSSLGPLQTQYFVRVSCRHMCAFLLGMFLESRLLGLRADTCIAFLGTVGLFCEVVVIVHTLPRKGEGPHLWASETCQSAEDILIPVEESSLLKTRQASEK